MGMVEPSQKLLWRALWGDRGQRLERALLLGEKNSSNWALKGGWGDCSRQGAARVWHERRFAFAEVFLYIPQTDPQFVGTNGDTMRGSLGPSLSFPVAAVVDLCAT